MEEEEKKNPFGVSFGRRRHLSCFCFALRDEPQNDFDDDFDATTLLRLLDEEETSLKPHLFPSSPGWKRTTRRRVSERGERHRL